MAGGKGMLRLDRPAITMLVAPPLLAGVVLGANQTRAGAFLPWVGSISYWLALSFATWGLIALATALARGLLRPWSPPAWSIWLVGAVAGSLVARPTIYAITGLYRPLMHAPTLRAMRPFTFDVAFLAYYLTNWSVIIAMWMLASWLEREWRVAMAKRFLAEKHADPPSAAASRFDDFLRRLPVDIGRDVIALQSEDHYVRVYTRTGNTLLLATLADAIAGVERGGIAGQRVHRSWWVAHGAVASAESRGRRLTAILGNGVEVPVSHTYRELAKLAGVLSAQA